MIKKIKKFLTCSFFCFQCLFSNVAFGFGCSYMSRYEEQGVGIQWYNVAESPIPEDKFSMLGSILVMFMDSLIYWLLAWYIESVFPGKFIIPLGVYMGKI